MSGNGPIAQPSADLLGLLEADPHGCALATAVRDEGGSIVDFTLAYLNEAGCRFLGRPRGELVGRTYRELWPETVTDGTLTLYRQVVRDRLPTVRTVYYDRPTVSGHFEIRVVPFGDGFVARFVDLTKLTMGSLTDGGTRLYDALDAAFDGFVLLRAVRDDAGAIIDFTREYVNQFGAKLAGRTAEDLIGRGIVEQPSGAGDIRLFRHLRAVAETGDTWHEQVTASATAQVWEVKAVRIDGRFVAVSYRDITEQVDHQRELQRSVAQARAAADRTTALQVVTAALVAATTPDEVYLALGTVLRPSAGGHGLAVLLSERNRQLLLRYHAGYEDDVVAQLREVPMSHPYPATGVAVTGQPRYLCSPEEFAAAQPDPDSRISGGGRKSWAFLPLATAGQILGTLVIGYQQPRQFDDAERANLVTFSRLAAQALQRALLHRAHLSIAADLQRALLPAALPALPGARHAVRYLPWTEGAEVGGDWYDVIHIETGRAAIVIGDVAGHSPQAAATMGQLRSALRAYAADGYHPADVMRRANEHLLRYEPHAMATCCYLELQLADHTATAVLAGHPPPVLRTGDRAEFLRPKPGPPLGTRRAEYRDVTLLLPTGCSLVMYTDGLIEDRHHEIDRGLTELRQAVQTAPTNDPDGLVDHILSAQVGPSPRSDDVAILALTVHHPATP
ncbi:SpoIIE family protein phosphatase [Actinoplanes sp. NPDC051633]|uniref:SpoIIE family protein phosphatase n=1 Tax=Actinoplanes sp. NPDC051633 TaxID=3155670 RepID=UPI003440B9B5